MKAISKILVGVVLLVLLSTTQVSATEPPYDYPTAHIYLYEKDPSTWAINYDGPWGKLQIMDNKNEMVVFNGHGLEPGVSYTLISYKEPWSARLDSYEIGSAEANECGDVHLNIKNCQEFFVWNDYGGDLGVKFWLIPTATWTGGFPWTSANWLFEEYIWYGFGV